MSINKVSLSNWLEPPHNRWAFQNVAEILPTVQIVNNSGKITHLPNARTNISNVTFTAADGSTTTWAKHLRESFCDAVCVIHDGQIVDEQYFNGMHEQSKHLLMSVTKSFTSAALGIAIGRGLLSPSSLVTEIAPEFCGTSLEGCTVRHLIDMTAGTEFVEDYDLYKDPESDVPLIEYERQAGFRPLGNRPTIGVLRHFSTYAMARPHGEVFDYRSPLTNIVARILEIVQGISFREILSRDIWSVFGMEHPAEISVDALGFPIAEAGLCCTVRDLARFGLAYLNDGVIEGKAVLPLQWVRDTQAGDEISRSCYLKYLDSLFGKGVEGDDWNMYHNAFWIKEPNKQFSGLGIFGQYVWVHRPTRTVIARFSTYPSAAPTILSAETIRGFNAIAQALN